MAQRKIAELLFRDNAAIGHYAGDEDAQRAAAALADRADSPTIVAITDAVAYALRMGGQISIATLRAYVDTEGTPVPEGEPGDWRTMGLAIFYETRDARIQIAKPPKEVGGIEVTDFTAPPTRVEIEAPEAPEVEPDLRDEIDAEADALADQVEPLAATG